MVLVGRHRGPMLAVGLLVLVPAMWSRPAQAFCRTTTCSLMGCVPPRCLRDDAIALTTLGTLSCNLPEYNKTGPNANGVIFRDQSWPYGTEIIGLTKVSFNTKTGEIRGRPSCTLDLRRERPSRRR